MNYFSEIYGLVTKGDPTTENGGLFFAHYLVLKKILGKEIVVYDHFIFDEKMKGAYVDVGLYKRSSMHNERTVSQDELTGMIVASFILGTKHRIEIVKYLKDHWGNYPATGVNKRYNPASYCPWYILSGEKPSIITRSWYALNLLISSNKNKDNTSSKLIYLCELFITKDESLFCNILYSYFSWRMKIMYGSKWVYALFYEYFHRTELSDFPLLELSKEV